MTKSDPAAKAIQYIDDCFLLGVKSHADWLGWKSAVCGQPPSTHTGRLQRL